MTFAELTRLRTRTELRDALLTRLGAAGFPVTSWPLGGVARTLVEGVAQGIADLWLAVAAIARGMLLDRAEHDWLTELARSHYDVARQPATFTQGYVRLTAVSGAGPYTISPASLVVSDGTRTFRSTNALALTLAVGGTLDVPVQAEAAGADSNVPSVSVLVTPALAGVDVASPAWGGGATWRTADGVDEEGDASVRARCRARWSTLGRGATLAAYAYLATTCPNAPGVTRAAVVPGPGDGTVRVYLATASGVASPAEVAAVQAYLDVRAPITDAPAAHAATAVPVTVTLAVQATDVSTANRARIETALGALQANLALGQRLDIGALYHAAYQAEGVRNATLTSPAADVVVSDDALAVMTWTVTMVAP